MKPSSLTQVAFAAGIDEGAADEVLDPASGFRRLENVRQEKNGSIQKRLGFAALPKSLIGGGSLAYGDKLFSHRGRVCSIGRNGLAVYDETLAQHSYAEIPQRADVSTQPVAMSPNVLDGVIRCRDLIVSIGYRERALPGPYAGSDASVRAALQYDVTATVQTLSGAIVRREEVVYSTSSLAATNPQPRLMHTALAQDGRFVYAFTYIDEGNGTATNVLRCFAFDTTAPTNGWVSVTSWSNVTKYAAARACDGDGRVFVVFHGQPTGGGAPNGVFYVHAINDTGSIANYALIAPELVYDDGLPLLQDLAISQDGSRVWFAHGYYRESLPSTSRVYLRGLDVTTLAQTIDDALAGDALTQELPYQIGSLRLSTNSVDRRLYFGEAHYGTFFIKFEPQATTGTPRIVTTGLQYVACAWVMGDTVWVNHDSGPRAYALASQPNASAGGMDSTSPAHIAPKEWRYAAISDSPATSPTSKGALKARLGTAVLCDVTDIFTKPWLPPVAVASPELVHWTAPQVFSLPGGIGVAYTVRSNAAANSVEIMRVTFNSAKLMQTAENAGCTYMSGGVLRYFDGERVSEVGFLTRPPRPYVYFDSLTQVTTQPIGPRGGKYRYAVTWESVDAAGNVVTSGVSDPTYIDATVTDKLAISVAVSPCVITSKLDGARDPDVRVCLWRTEATGEAPYYLAATFERATNNASRWFNYYDDQKSYATNRLLYGTGQLPGIAGAAQDRRAPPYANHVVSYAGMLVIASGRSLWYSGQTIDGEGMWFSPVFVTSLQDETITALAVMDGVLYVFTASGIYAVTGEPPSDNGAAGGLGALRKVSSDVGCINSRSVVSTTSGVFFESAHGIELLDRSGSVSPIGVRVQSTLEAFPVITSAVLDDTNRLVRFAVQARSTGGSGRDIVFDLQSGQWQSVDSRYGFTDNEPSMSACMVTLGGLRRYAWLGFDGAIYYEKLASDATAHLDGSNWITMAAETGWFKFGGIQGRHHLNKVLVLARKASRADLKTLLSYDYSLSPKAVYTRTADAIDTLSAAIGRIQLEHQLHDEAEGVSMKLRIEDSTPTGGTVGNGAGASWISIAIEGAPVDGATALPEGGM